MEKLETLYKNINEKQKWGHPKSAGLWSKLTLGWLDKYIKNAAAGINHNPSEFPKILESDSTILWTNKLEMEIMKMNSNVNKYEDFNVNIFRAVFNVLRGSLFRILLGKIFCEILGIFIADRLKLSLKTIEAFSELNKNHDEYYILRKEGIKIAIVISLLQILFVISTTQIGYYICRQTVRIQGSITHLLYRSVLSRGINRIEIGQDTNDFKGEDTTSIYNSILIDMNIVVKVIVSLVDIVIIPIRMILVLTMLTRTMGDSVLSRPAMFCIIFISLLVILLEVCLAFFKWNYLVRRDERMNIMDYTIKKLSSIKILGLESLFYWSINGSRINELRSRKSFVVFQSISSVLYSTANLITQYTLFKTVLICSVLYGLEVPTSKIVTSYYVIDMFSQRLSDLPLLISTIVEGNNSKIRMESVIRYVILRNLEIKESLRRDAEFQNSVKEIQNNGSFESNTNFNSNSMLEESSVEDFAGSSFNININEEIGIQKARNISDSTVVLIKNVELINDLFEDRININLFQVERSCMTVIEDHSSERLQIFVQAILGYNDYGCQVGPKISNCTESIFYIRRISCLPIFWCSHDPWIPSGTIRSIILCGSPMIKNLYKLALFACDLNADIFSWKDKDLRFVDGRQGLSGGQIARIGLARAVYKYLVNSQNDADFDHLFILDNCFRSIDIPVAINIMLRLFTGEEAILQDANTILIISPVLKEILFSKSVGTFSCSIREYKFRNDGITEGFTIFKKNLIDGNVSKNFAFANNNPSLSIENQISEDEEIFRNNKQDSPIQYSLNVSENEQYPLCDSNLQKMVSFSGKTSSKDKFISESDLIKAIQSKEILPLLEDINEIGSVSSKTYGSYLSSVNKIMLFLIFIGVLITVFGGILSQFGFTYFLDLICETNNQAKDLDIIKGNAPMNVMPYGPSRNIDLRKHVSRFVLDKFKGPLEYILGVHMSRNGRLSLDTNQLIGSFGLMLFIIIMSTFGTYIFEAVACIQACKFFHNNLLYKVLINSSIPTLMKISAGQILNKFSTDIILIDWNTMRSFGRVTWGLVSLVMNICILITLAPWTLPIFLVMMGLVFFRIFLPMIAASRNLQRINLIAFSPICSIMSSTLEGSRTIFLLKNSEYFEKTALNILEFMQRIRLLQHTSLIWCNTRIQFFILPISIINSIFPYVTPFTLSSIENKRSNSIFLFYLNLLSQPITIAWGISKCLSLAENATCLMADYIQLEKEMCSIERINDLVNLISKNDKDRNYLRHEEDKVEKNMLLKLKSNSSRRSLFLNKDSEHTNFKKTYDNIFVSLLSANDLSNHRNPVLSISNVFIDYEVPDKGELCKNSILKDISLKAFSGEVVGLIGRTGSGKSSLFNSILKISPITSGAISLLGQSIHLIPRHILRNKIGVIPQAMCILPNCTVRDVIDPFFQYSDNEVHSVLKICGIYKYVINTLNGINSKISLQKNPINISESRKPRLCASPLCLSSFKISNEPPPFVISEIYLRFLYTCRIVLYSKNYNLILIDEPIIFQDELSKNSSMNEQTMQIIDIISTYCSHCAVITISHDINIIKKCKRIYHISDGLLKEISFINPPTLN
ncbi:ABC transporter [Cryptosporidium ubiquitum]|uniref:ABC transporter n=1 Tax=Cryptosporidium ubiquitum TaxID=857276 RepID=A0A1J4MPP5_9CRYT|nr:ABC transporter [Cryptosporidium ubiquitum]OII74956.1 ABC transporter [Cryptosporidium ubiquitum]